MGLRGNRVPTYVLILTVGLKGRGEVYLLYLAITGESGL